MHYILQIYLIVISLKFVNLQSERKKYHILSFAREQLQKKGFFQKKCGKG